MRPLTRGLLLALAGLACLTCLVWGWRAYLGSSLVQTWLLGYGFCG